MISLAAVALATLQSAAQRSGAREAQPPAYPYEVVPRDALWGHLSEGNFREPHGVCFESTARELFVADSKNGRIGIFSEAGTPLFTFGGGALMIEPRSVLAIADGTIFVLDASRTQIGRFNYRGEPEERLEFARPREADPAAGATEPAVPITIAAFARDAQGRWIVADRDEGRVWVFDAERRTARELPPPIGAKSFGTVSDVAVSPTGLIAVSDQRGVALSERLKTPAIHVYDASGKMLAAFGERDIGLDNFTSPAAVEFDEEGFLYAVDSLRHDVKIFTSSGRFVGRFGGWFTPETRGRAAGELLYPVDIAIAPGGPIYVAERFGQRVQIFERKPVSPR